MSRRDRNILESTFEYDKNGNMIRQVNPDGREIRYEYDSNNNKIRQVNPNGLEFRWKVDYYDNGQLKRYGDLFLPQF